MFSLVRNPIIDALKLKTNSLRVAWSRVTPFRLATWLACTPLIVLGFFQLERLLVNHELESLNRAIESNDTSWHAYYFNQRGRADFRRGLYREAAIDFQAAFRISREWTTAFNIGLAMSEYDPYRAEEYFHESDTLRGQPMDRTVQTPYDTLDGPSAAPFNGRRPTTPPPLPSSMAGNTRINEAPLTKHVNGE